MCRTELPPGPRKMLEGAVRLYMAIPQRVGRGEAPWGAMAVEEQKQPGEVLGMLTKAAEQGHVDENYNLGIAYDTGLDVAQNGVEAVRWQNPPFRTISNYSPRSKP